MKRDEQGLKNLRTMMKALAVRRTKGPSGVAGRQEQLISVVLTEAERSQYKAVRAHAKEQSRNLSGSGSMQPSYVILQAITRLRLLCSHGRTDVGPDSTASAPAWIQTGSCNQCGSTLLPTSTLGTQSYGSCSHTLCSECYMLHSAFLDTFPTPSSLACLICPEASEADGDSMDWTNTSTGDADIDVDLFDLPSSSYGSSKLARVVSQLLEIDRGCPSVGRSPEKR